MSQRLFQAFMLFDEFLMRMARVVEYAYAMSMPESMARWVSFRRQRLK